VYNADDALVVSQLAKIKPDKEIKRLAVTLHGHAQDEPEDACATIEDDALIMRTREDGIVAKIPITDVPWLLGGMHAPTLITSADIRTKRCLKPTRFSPPPPTMIGTRGREMDWGELSRRSAWYWRPSKAPSVPRSPSNIAWLMPNSSAMARPRMYSSRFAAPCSHPKARTVGSFAACSAVVMPFFVATRCPSSAALRAPIIAGAALTDR